jgi:large subunit ribosomal protein L25
MQIVDLEAKQRELKTKGALQTIRQGGEIPAVVYGGKKNPSTVSVVAKGFQQLVKAHGENVVVNLKLGSETETVLVKEIQRDPLSRAFIHVDFQRISLTEKIEVDVPVHVKGEAPGVKLAGGILEHILREVRVRCLPTNIPGELHVDVSGLDINQGLRVKDIQLEEGLEILTDPEQLVVNIVAPTVLEEEPAAAATAAAGPAEPEVIAKGKKPEEGAEAAAPAGKEAKGPAKEAPAKPTPK